MKKEELNKHIKTIKNLLKGYSKLSKKEIDVSLIKERAREISKNIKLIEEEVNDLYNENLELKSYQDDYKSLFLIMENMTQNKDIKSNIELFGKVLNQILKVEKIAIFTLMNDVNWELKYNKGLNKEKITELLLNFVESGIVDWVFNQQKPSVLPEMNSENENYYLLVPLVAIKMPVGMALVKLNSVTHHISSYYEDIITIFANQLAVNIEDNIFYREMNSHINNLYRLFEVNKLLSSSLDVGKINDIFLDKMMELSKFNKSALFNIVNEKIQLVMKKGFSDKINDLKGMPYEKTFIKDAIINKTHMVIYDLKSDIRYNKYGDLFQNEISSLIIVPLFFHSGEIKILLLGRRKKIDFIEEDVIQLLLMLRNQVIVAFENAKLYKITKDLTLIDDLTKLYNSRYLNSLLERELKRSKRYNLQFSILFMDIDNFKMVNDKYGGHLIGSETLREFGYLLKSILRQSDIAARYGGDEFVVIAPETTLNNAIMLAERIQNITAEYKFLKKYGLNLHITVSVGIANYPLHGTSAKELLEKADKAMYYIKDAGKNNVKVAEIPDD